MSIPFHPHATMRGGLRNATRSLNSKSSLIGPKYCDQFSRSARDVVKRRSLRVDGPHSVAVNCVDHSVACRSHTMPHVITPAEIDHSDRFAIVVAKWNEAITRKLLDGALKCLGDGGVADEAIDVAWVPGSFEIPLVAQEMAGSARYAAVLCLGAVIRGETTHDQHINRAVSLAISEIARATNVPVLFGVLTCETMEQAIHRAGGNVGNKGAECAEAALELVGLLKSLR